MLSEIFPCSSLLSSATAAQSFEKTKVVSVEILSDGGWDSEELVVLENGIVLKVKWMDGLFLEGEEIGLSFLNEDRELVVTRDRQDGMSYELRLFQLCDKFYIAL